MNANQRTLRSRKPLADLTNTVASASPASSSSSSKPQPSSISKPSKPSKRSSKPSLPAAKKPGHDAVDSATAAAATAIPTPTKITRSPNGETSTVSGFVDLTTSETGALAGDGLEHNLEKEKVKGRPVLHKPVILGDTYTSRKKPGSSCNLGNAGSTKFESLIADLKLQISEKARNEGSANVLHEPINVKDSSIPQQQLASAHNPGRVGCMAYEPLSLYGHHEKTKDKGKAVCIRPEPVNAEEPAISRQLRDPMQNYGTIDYTRSNTLAENLVHQPLDKTKDKGKAVYVDAEPIYAQDPASSQRQSKSSHYAAGNFWQSGKKLKQTGNSVSDPSTSRRLPESFHNSAGKFWQSREKLTHTGVSVFDPSTSHQLPESFHNSGAIDCTPSDSLMVDARRQLLEGNIRKKNLLGTIHAEEPSTPQQQHESSCNPGTGDCEISKSTTVYARRHPAKRWKNKDKARGIPSSCPPPKRINKTGDNFNLGLGDSAQPKSCPNPYPRCKKNKKCSLPLEFIDQQRAYFAEVDAFELPEEILSSSDSG